MSARKTGWCDCGRRGTSSGGGGYRCRVCRDRERFIHNTGKTKRKMARREQELKQRRQESGIIGRFGVAFKQFFAKRGMAGMPGGFNYGRYRNKNAKAA